MNIDTEQAQVAEPQGSLADAINNLDDLTSALLGMDQAHTNVFADYYQPRKPGAPTPKYEPMKRSALSSFLDEAFVDFIGMDSVKEELFQQASFLEVQKLRAAQGFKSPGGMSRHLIFTGAPGTGKTTVARVVAQLYKQLGILPTDKVIEADRSSFIAGFTGQTALKTQALINSAIGGVLFIDEAYTLCRTGDAYDTFGAEAIGTLLKMMEDHRHELVVIIAGYKKEIDQFLLSNPGLTSRFNKSVDFPNYSAMDLLSIFENMVIAHSYVCKDWYPFQEDLLAYFEITLETQKETFSNGRFIRNLFERATERHAKRIMLQSDQSVKALQTLLPIDIRGGIF